jgi:choline dehydrogenase-like flavoprotein
MGVIKPETLNDKEAFFDFLIIGSGAGGGTCAGFLIEDGLNVAIVEEGDYIPPDKLPNTVGEAFLKLYRNAGAHFIFGVPGIAFAEGRCVGGSTVINGGMCWRTPEKILQKWRLEEGIEKIEPSFMEGYFERIEKRINVVEQPPHTWSRAGIIFKNAAESLGWKVVTDRRNQKGCRGLSLCMAGCPAGAKQSVLHTYIQDFLKRNGTIFAGFRAERIIFKGNKAVGVYCKGGGKELLIKAKILILACGADETPSLLMRSGFKSSSGMLGKNLYVHPNVKAIGVFDEELYQWRGAHQSHQVHEFRDEGILLATGGVPPSMIAMSVEETGRKLGEFMENIKNMLFAGTLIEDTGTGMVKNIFGGKPVLLYNLNDYDFYRVKRALSLLSTLLFEGGAKEVILPFRNLKSIKSPSQIPLIFDNGIKKMDTEMMTVHIMGTAKMSGNPKRGVVDTWGRVYGTENMFVCDASIFPSPIGLNPMLSIMAFSARTAEYIIENKNRL